MTCRESRWWSQIEWCSQATQAIYIYFGITFERGESESSCMHALSLGSGNVQSECLLDEHRIWVSLRQLEVQAADDRYRSGSLVGVLRCSPSRRFILDRRMVMGSLSK